LENKAANAIGVSVLTERESLQIGQNVTNQKRPTYGGSDKIQPGPSAEKERVAPVRALGSPTDEPEAPSFLHKFLYTTPDFRAQM
jgi:hypothetical protein